VEKHTRWCLQMWASCFPLATTTSGSSDISTLPIAPSQLVCERSFRRWLCAEAAPIQSKGACLQHSDIIYSCVSQIAAGAFFSLALLETKPNSDPDTTHELWAWGDNHFGQLGCVRTKVTSASDSDGVVVAVSQSYRVICPLSEEKPETAATVHIVKEPLVVDPFGLLGNSKGLRISSIHAGAYHSIILAENGTVYSLGWNGRGQLGWPVNLAGMSSDQPLHVPLSAHDIRKVAVGGFHTSVLLSTRPRESTR